MEDDAAFEQAVDDRNSLFFFSLSSWRSRRSEGAEEGAVDSGGGCGGATVKVFFVSAMLNFFIIMMRRVFE